MIELEIQALSLAREGLLVDVGRSVIACGFALVRQRLADDRHGVLLTMAVRGPAGKRRALEAALDKHERIISFEISPVVDGPPRPHFAASRTTASNYVPPPLGAAPGPVSHSPKPPAAAERAIRIPPAPEGEPVVARPSAAPAPAPPPEPEPEFVFFRTPSPAPAPATVPMEPYKELVLLEADQAAVEKLLPKLMSDYPRILPWVKALEQAVVEGARESSLLLAGQRVGTWLFERDHAPAGKTSLDQAMQHVGVPALLGLADVDYSGHQLHIRNSPLCTQEGRSSCKFFSGYLQGLIGTMVASPGLSIFEVCCRSCGADECVLALMD